jgi:ABC-type glycerol-3-phosphate transport system substrate-binding protein
MLKKGIMILLIGMMAVLSACASEPASTKAPDNLKQDPVELVVYYPFRSDWPEEAFNTAFKEPLEKKYPHITIKYIVGGAKGFELPEVLTAGQKIDILFASTGATQGSLIETNMPSPR